MLLVQLARSHGPAAFVVHVEHADKQVSFHVRDHGRGITASETRDLFRPFSKSASQAASSAPGVGLGLSLSRRLAQDLGGRLEFVRCQGPGAAFVLTLPVGDRCRRD